MQVCIMVNGALFQGALTPQDAGTQRDATRLDIMRRSTQVLVHLSCPVPWCLSTLSANQSRSVAEESSN